MLKTAQGYYCLFIACAFHATNRIADPIQTTNQILQEPLKLCSSKFSVPTQIKVCKCFCCCHFWAVEQKNKHLTSLRCKYYYFCWLVGWFLTVKSKCKATLPF